VFRRVHRYCIDLQGSPRFKSLMPFSRVRTTNDCANVLWSMLHIPCQLRQTMNGFCSWSIIRGEERRNEGESCATILGAHFSQSSIGVLEYWSIGRVLGVRRGAMKEKAVQQSQAPVSQLRV